MPSRLAQEVSEPLMSIAQKFNRPFTTPRPAAYGEIPPGITRKQAAERALPPGPTPALSDFLTATFLINTPKFLLRLRQRYGDHCSFFLARRLFLGLFSPEATYQVTVAQQSNFVKGVGFLRMRKVLGEGLLTNEEPIHLQHRRLMQPPFHHHNLDKYVAIMTRITNDHLAHWHNEKAVDLNPEMMALTLNIVSQCLFGIDGDKYTRPIAEAMEVAIDRIERTMLPGLDRFDSSRIPYFQRFEQSADELATIAEEIIEKRLANQTYDAAQDNDLLGVLLGLRDHISMNHIRDEALTLILSGHETTANVLSWAFAHLSNNPDSYQALHDESRELYWLFDDRTPTYDELEKHARYTSAVLWEALRLAPPVWVAPRIAINDCEIAGVRVPAGAHVLVSQYVTQRDPRYFPEPDRFIPERWLDPGFEKSLPKGAYFPFGAGTRKCLGEYFAIAESRIILLKIARRWRINTPMPKAQPRATYRPHGKMRAQLFSIT
jgi:cytochrome P450